MKKNTRGVELMKELMTMAITKQLETLEKLIRIWHQF